jgi:hypothetical protein
MKEINIKKEIKITALKESLLNDIFPDHIFLYGLRFEK